MTNEITERLDRIVDAQGRILEQIRIYGERVARTEAQLESLFDNGQPGEITKLKNAVVDLQQHRWKAEGFLIAAAILFEAAYHYILNRIGAR
jgi:hypothetical protein